MYNLEYFISRFETIPADQWAEYTQDDSGVDGQFERKDVYGHAGDLEAQDALFNLCRGHGLISFVCLGDEEFLRYGKSPKQRVLRFLAEVKKSRDPYLSAV